MKKQKRKGKSSKTVCVVCQNEREGAPVTDDFVIKGLRRIKQFFKASTGNKLVVCPACRDIAVKKRQGFEKTLLTYFGLGGIILLVLIVFTLMSGGPMDQMIVSIFTLLILVVLLSALAFLNYFPSYEGYESSKSSKKPKK